MSSGFRVTQRSIGVQALHNLQGNLDRLGRLQQQLSSGKVLSRPSDSPTGSVASLRLRSEVHTNEQYERNASDALGWLGTIDKSLTGSLSLLRRARDLTLQGMSSGTAAAPAAREAVAAELRALRENLLGVANTRYLDRPVFGGTTTGTQAYDSAGGYVGDANPVQRTIADGTQIRVDVDGPTAFGSGAGDLFDILADLASGVLSSPASLGAELGRLDGAVQALQSSLADVGARFNRIEQMKATAEERVLDLKNSLSEVEDVDLPKTIVELQMQEVAYQAALGATARVMQPSLVDFLR